MNADAVVDEHIMYLQHILDTVPFAAETQPSGFFLDIYKLSYADITSLGITEMTWAAYNQVPTNKLLKLSISFGNLLKTFDLERYYHNKKHSNQSKTQNLGRQTKDPVGEKYRTETVSVAPYHVAFTKNFCLLLKNFDIGPAAVNMITSTQRQLYASCKQQARNSQGSRVSGEISIQNNGPIANSPIKLNSRQLLVEKLEINIKLDPLFTLKINIMLLQKLFAIMKSSLGDNGAIEESIEGLQANPRTRNYSVFSSSSGTSLGTDSTVTFDEFNTLILEVARRVSIGILDPFIDLLKTQIVIPRLTKGFQDFTYSL